MAGDIASISQQLGAAVELTMNPSVPMEQRHQVSDLGTKVFQQIIVMLLGI